MVGKMRSRAALLHVVYFFSFALSLICVPPVFHLMLLGLGMSTIFSWAFRYSTIIGHGLELGIPFLFMSLSMLMYFRAGNMLDRLRHNACIAR